MLTGLLFNIPKIWSKPSEIYDDGKYWDIHEVDMDYDSDSDSSTEKDSTSQASQNQNNKGERVQKIEESHDGKIQESHESLEPLDSQRTLNKKWPPTPQKTPQVEDNAI